MPFLGAHLSIAGGVSNAVAAATRLGCAALQIFTKSPNSWAAKPIDPADAAQFKRAVKAAGLRYPTAHDSYLINLASPDDAHFNKSIDALVIELERAEQLGLSYLVSHPGAHNGSGEDAGLGRIAAALDAVHKRCKGFKVKLLVETTAGSGTCLGGKFEHVRRILDGVRDASRLGVCLDTCHVFAAGYPIGTPNEYAETFGAFDHVVGFEHIKLFHVNDSVPGLGSRVDRHAGLGLGQIGIEFFRRLVTDPRFRDLPMVLETPKEADDGTEMDPVNLAVLRGFLSEAVGA
ncbi:deoxyribonuclease IV [Gemmata sp.]|uniref:deoxyribonuclease IV n=1 Tax=Gemmata sp. TaxID=1914242 RepID=UPI003F6F4251